MTRSELPTGTVTFLFSDIEGSTRLVGELDPLLYREVLEQHNEIIRTAVSAHGGVERGTQGDAFLVVFRDAPSALATAVGIQRAIAGADWPDDRHVAVRMGLHSGHGIAGGDDYVGLDINRAARISAAAHGGQVLLSDATRALVDRGLPDEVSLRDLGEHRLKDLARPERLFQVVVPGLRSDFPPPNSLGGPVGRLPVRLTTFVGRSRELEELGRLIAAQRLVTLTGPGGTGKSSLAVEAARAASPSFEDGAWFVALESVTDPELVPTTIATTLGLVETGPASDRVLAFAAHRSLLLVLDNLEQVRGSGPFIADLLRAAPDVRVLATSRAPLRISGEQEYPVAPLSVPESPETARASECVILFTERARRVRPSFEPTDEEVAAISEICARLDGLPLGIELAAGRTGLLPPATIAERLGRHLELPGAGPTDVPERQRTLTGAIAWSHDLLDEPRRRLFARLAVFVGGARLDEIEAVCGDEPGVDILESLAALVEQSLVVTAVGPDGPRFGLLETIRAFAADQLARIDERDIIRERHARAYLALAESAAPHLPGRDQVRWMTLLAADDDNLRAGTRWALEQDDPTLALRSVAASWRYWQIGGHLHEGLEVCERAMAMAGAERPTVWRLHALDALGGIHYWRGEPTAAADVYAAQLALARELGDPRGIAEAAFNMAFPLAIAGGWDESMAVIDESIAIFDGLGDARSAARAGWSRSVDLQMSGATELSLAEMEAWLERFRQLDDLPYVALSLGGLAWGSLHLGRIDVALDYAARTMLAHHELGDVATTSLSLLTLAVGVGMLGRIDDGAAINSAYEAAASRYGVRPPMALEQIAMGPEFDILLERYAGPDLVDARARGAAMSLDEAVDFAARTAGEIVSQG